MQDHIAPQDQDQVEQMPLWAASHIGGRVRLIRDWVIYTPEELGEHAYLAPEFVVKALSTGVLDGVQQMSDGSVYALVMFDEAFHDPSAVVDLPFSLLRPADKVESTHPYAHIEGRAGEIAVMWASGVNVRSRLAKATFYRYRDELLTGHGIDISQPTGAQ